MAWTYQDFNKACRVCLKREHVELTKFPPVSLQFYKHLLSMPQDQPMEGPTQICRECFICVQNFHSFYSKCLKIEAIIQEMCDPVIQPTDLPLDINDYEIKVEPTVDLSLDINTDTIKTEPTVDLPLDINADTIKTEPTVDLPLDINADKIKIEPNINNDEIKIEDIKSEIIDLTTEDRQMEDDEVTTSLGSKPAPENLLKRKLVNVEREQPKRLKTSISEASGSYQEVPGKKIDPPVKTNFGHPSTSKCTTSNKSKKSKSKKKVKKRETNTLTNPNFSNVELFQCQTCSLSHGSKLELFDHFSRGCAKSFQQFIYNQTNLDTNQKFFCGKCSKEFECLNFVDHLAKKHRKLSIPCFYCDKIFNKPYKCHNHIYSVHTQEKAFKCTVCSAEFITKQIFQAHLTKSNHRLAKSAWKPS